MNSDTPTISLDDQVSADVIENKLMISLKSTLPQSINEQFVLSARDNNQSLIGGLTASTSYGWMLIKTLWVDSSYRRKGTGSALLKSALAHAARLGCHAAWLDTSNPEAMRFYEHAGFEVFGQLNNQPGQTPETHQRWFMKLAIPDRHGLDEKHPVDNRPESARQGD